MKASAIIMSVKKKVNQEIKMIFIISLVIVVIKTTIAVVTVLNYCMFIKLILVSVIIKMTINIVIYRYFIQPT